MSHHPQIWINKLNGTSTYLWKLERFLGMYCLTFLFLDGGGTCGWPRGLTLLSKYSTNVITSSAFFLFNVRPYSLHCSWTCPGSLEFVISLHVQSRRDEGRYHQVPLNSITDNREQRARGLGCSIMGTVRSWESVTFYFAQQNVLSLQRKQVVTPSLFLKPRTLALIWDLGCVSFLERRGLCSWPSALIFTQALKRNCWVILGNK